MSATASDIDLRAQLASIDRTMAETRKLLAEAGKLRQEGDKLEREGLKLLRDRGLAPWQMLATFSSGGLIVFLITALGRARGWWP